MTLKNVLTVLGVIILTFIYVDITVWLVPFLISMTTLYRFWKNDVAKFIGIFSLKQTFIISMAILFSNSDFLNSFFQDYHTEIVIVVFTFSLELILTLIIVYSFKKIFNTEKVIWSFLIGDITRWLVLFIERIIPDPFPEPFFFTQLYIFVFFLFVFPSVYAIIGYIFVRERFLEESSN